MDPRIYVDVAENCILGGAPEWYRTSVNRAYYGTYGVAQAFLESLGYTIPRAGYAHYMVRDILLTSGIPELEVAGGQVKNLYRLRLEADYRHGNQTAETQNRANQAVKIARRAITSIDKASKAQRRAEIVEILFRKAGAAGLICETIVT